MPRSPRSRRAKSKAADKKSERSLSYTRTPLPPSPSDNRPTASSAMDINKDIEKAVAGCLKGDDFVDKIVAKLTAKVRDAVLEALSQSLRDARSRIDELNQEVSKLRTELKRVEVVEKSVEEAEQYQRRNNLRVFGIPEARGESTDGIVIGLFKDKLDIDLPLERVERTHRVGRPRPPGDDGKPRHRPIIVRFNSYRDRREVFSNKKRLKGSGITIREDLTTKRAEVLRHAIQQHGPSKVWTVDGRIIWDDGAGNRRSATTLGDLK